MRFESPAASAGDGQLLPPLLELPELPPELAPELPEPELEEALALELEKAPEVEDALELDVVLPLLPCVTDVLAVVRPPAPPPPVSPP